MEESSFILLRPHEIRKKYTEFVMANKSRALLPSRTILRQSAKKGANIRDTRNSGFHEEESKINLGSSQKDYLELRSSIR